ncbi:deoxyhypusine synthase [Vulcanisaeta distributa]|uniref:Probable deoxyhypusine synthase n=1 Tax=Vulcanisaeta distributa (strain DSM 14429 / JCM 11212 / NBRC 100878 / IC-017) TaxID=572478 RepID=E1QR25_VULDI|nr:deoxyhypusine synthase [Vulcanisaeta distributa]ADN51715.1 Deoxyhypusine synthase [Vulcanisaeta distributa DSM 14429]
MSNSPFISSEVYDLDVGINTIDDLIEAYKRIGGFQGRYIAEAADVLLSMYNDPNTTVFLSFTANLISTGLRGLLARFIERGFADVIITTAGTLDHDIAKSMGGKYYQSYFDVDDIEMSKAGIHRIGNVAVRKEHYGPLIEKFVHSSLEELSKIKEEWGVRELLWEMGRRIDDDYSILRAASRAGVPIYVPGFVDGAFGTAILTYNEMQRTRTGGRQVRVDVLKDEHELMDIVYSSKSLGALIIGGGISKHHVIWWSQFAGGLDYVVYITMAVEWDGSLSGARPKEAITWGKVKPTARQAFILEDATVVLPILIPYVVKKLGFRRGVRVIT